MATRDDLVARRDALTLELEAAVVRIAAGDRSQQIDLAEKRRARDALTLEIGRVDTLGLGPMARQIRVSSSRGY